MFKMTMLITSVLIALGAADTGAASARQVFARDLCGNERVVFDTMPVGCPGAGSYPISISALRYGGRHGGEVETAAATFRFCVLGLSKVPRGSIRAIRGSLCPEADLQPAELAEVRSLTVPGWVRFSHPVLCRAHYKELPTPTRWIYAVTEFQWRGGVRLLYTTNAFPGSYRCPRVHGVKERGE